MMTVGCASVGMTDMRAGRWDAGGRKAVDPVAC